MGRLDSEHGLAAEVLMTGHLRHSGMAAEKDDEMRVHFVERLQLLRCRLDERLTSPDGSEGVELRADAMHVPYQPAGVICLLPEADVELALLCGESRVEIMVGPPRWLDRPNSHDTFTTHEWRSPPLSAMTPTRRKLARTVPLSVRMVVSVVSAK